MQIPSNILKQKAIMQGNIDTDITDSQLKPHQPALCIEDQILNLKQLGLVFKNEEKAQDILGRVSYFRLVKAYCVGLKPRNGTFDGETSFEDLVDLYNYNSELRQLLLTQIERIEITLRCRLANYFCGQYGVLGYKDANNFADSSKHETFMSEVYNSIAYNSRSPFIRNFQENYQGRDVPFYALVEILSFGTLSKFFKNMKNIDKKAISRDYGNNWPYLESWFETLAYVRNICAHYGRLYNIRLDKTPKLRERKEGNNSTIRVFWAIYCIKKLLLKDEEWINFIVRLNELFLLHPSVEKEKMGFPDNWQDLLAA